MPEGHEPKPQADSGIPNITAGFQHARFLRIAPDVLADQGGGAADYQYGQINDTFAL